ncbi:DUF6771 family protein [Sphingomonas sp. GB1N7]|uniref:DUF6771 family protein n=1 Tax=Parasphingomonas caseinilytica TaxID=3096158 RepID=UPI002FC9D9E4
MIGDQFAHDLARSMVAHSHEVFIGTGRCSCFTPVPFYNLAMLDSLITPAIVPDLSAAILSASAITRLGLACPDERARQRAADALARTIVERMTATTTVVDENQLALPI